MLIKNFITLKFIVYYLLINSLKTLKKSYVYLICDPAQDLYKIGVTRNLYSKRMKQLQTGNGTELHLIKFYETFYPFNMEKYLHSKFQEKREHGEWFRLNIEDISSFELLCQKYEEIVLSLKENPFFMKDLH